MMPDNESPASEFDWRVTSFEGARREQLRRWARLPLERILLAIEEMQDIAHALGTVPAGRCDEIVLRQEGNRCRPKTTGSSEIKA